jgi:hypothetical protein
MLTAVVKGRRRTDQKMGALADAQKRTDEKVGLLADAQARTEWAVKDLAKEVGGLSAALDVARPGNLQRAEFPQVQCLVVDAPGHSIRGDDQLQLAGHTAPPTFPRLRMFRRGHRGAEPLRALRSSWVVGVLVGWFVVRLAVCWPVSWDVVVAVDMKWFLRC